MVGHLVRSSVAGDDDHCSLGHQFLHECCARGCMLGVERQATPDTRDQRPNRRHPLTSADSLDATPHL